MRRLILVIAVLFTGAVSYAQKPAGISVYTWTREDIFAGLIGGNFDQLNAGMKKLDDILKENPNDADALIMRAAGLSALAVRDLGKGDKASFDKQYDEAIRILDAAYKREPQNLGVSAVYGGITLYNFGKLPEERRQHAVQMARRSYNVLFKAQEAALDKMPLHLKGEVLAGLAESEWRSGNTAEAQAYLNRIVQTMPNTAYAQRAEQWIKNPSAITATNRLVCQSCHEPGRLKNVLAPKQ